MHHRPGLVVGQVGSHHRELDRARRRADGHVYLLGVHEGAGVQAGVEPLHFLPPSAVAVLSGSAATQRRGRGLAWEERRARPGVVTGEARASLKVLVRK